MKIPSLLCINRVISLNQKLRVPSQGRLAYVVVSKPVRIAEAAGLGDAVGRRLQAISILCGSPASVILLSILAQGKRVRKMAHRYAYIISTFSQLPGTSHTAPSDSGSWEIVLCPKEGRRNGQHRHCLLPLWSHSALL